MVQRIDDKTHIAFLVHSQLSPLDIYKYLFDEFDVQTDFTGKTEGDLLRMLGDFFVQCAHKGENCLLIVDEAQNLSQDVLEQMRLFLNFETYDRKLLQIILAGHPELHDTLSLLTSAKLKQRVSMAYDLLPLDASETQGYIEKRLMVAGARNPIYTDGAIAEVYRCSQGIPRVINIVCDLALVLGHGKTQGVLDRDMILQAAQMLHVEAAHVPRVRNREQAQEHEVQAPPLHPSAGHEPLQDVLSSSRGRMYLDVVSKIQGRLDRVDAPSSQAPANRRRFRWPLLGGIAASLAVSLLFLGGFLHEPARLKHGVSTFVQSGAQLFTASPSAPPSAAPSSARQESRPEPTSTAASLFPQEQGSMESTRLTGTSGAAPAPSDAVASPGPRSTPRVIVVQAGDTLGKILLRTYKRLDRRLLTLVQGANPHLTNPAHIEIGQRLVLPNLSQ